ncbi:DUF7677 family protein [Streptomyces sp. NRRL S-237]|uniref:DUF7677 family protein n=1 Tax=Streptomyces sp. NRRL S-237 TaxID=1463895 RepID=UPI001F27B19F|nr:hypothetical protein [Streptomyces sp. NRRL S-237]
MALKPVRPMKDGLVAHLPTDVRAALRFFAFFLGNGTLDVELLEGIDYREHLFTYGSDLEMVIAVFTNVLEVDDHGRTLNDGDAQYRAAQWIRGRCDPEYRVEPPFEAWETELHGP